jgi:hypothetical protein
MFNKHTNEYMYSWCTQKEEAFRMWGEGFRRLSKVMTYCVLGARKEASMSVRREAAMPLTKRLIYGNTGQKQVNIRE